MPFNGSGTYAPPSPAYPAITNTTISSTYFNQIISDMAAALSDCVTRDGQSVPLANLPMGGYKLTGLGVGSASADSVTYGQVFSSPVFTSPSLAGNPAAADNSLLIPSTSWVVASYAPLTSPALAGTPTAPTATAGTNTNQIATTAFVMTQAYNVSLPAKGANTYLYSPDGVTLQFASAPTTPDFILQAQGIA